MPVHEVRRNGILVGYRYGRHGKLYTIGSYGKGGARRRAEEQGSAIEHSQKRAGKKVG
jgi:hypothetical protein